MRYIVLFLIMANAAIAETFFPSTASYGDVSAAVSGASPGDIVVVPAGTVSWSGGITLNGVTLQGPGKDAGSPCTVTAGTITVQKHATYNTKLIGFRFTGNSQHLSVSGGLSAEPFMIGDCYFQADTFEPVMQLTTNGGVFYDCEFYDVSPGYEDLMYANLGAGGNGAASDAADPTIGTDDTNGDVNTYFEDCTWTNFNEVALDCDNGSRIVFRYCTFNDSSITCHGGGNPDNDTSDYGVKHLEVYNCTFNRISNDYAVNKWVWWRGGTGVFANNAVDDADSPDGNSYPNKPEIMLTVGCPNPYPMSHQVGQAYATPENPPSYPVLIFGNTGHTLTITRGANPNDPCATPTSYIQLNRDYYLSNSWGWAPFEYPHPLRSEGGDVTPPGFSSASVATDGITSTITLDEATVFGAGGNGGVTLSGSIRGAQSGTYSSGSGSTALVYTVPLAFYSAETVTVDYSQPGNGWEDAAGNDVGTFSGQAVTNNSTVQPPASSITVTTFNIQ